MPLQQILYLTGKKWLNKAVFLKRLLILQNWGCFVEIRKTIKLLSAKKPDLKICYCRINPILDQRVELDDSRLTVLDWLENCAFDKIATNGLFYEFLDILMGNQELKKSMIFHITGDKERDRKEFIG